MKKIKIRKRKLAVMLVTALTVAFVVCGLNASAQSIEAFRVIADKMYRWTPGDVIFRGFQQLGTAENPYYMITIALASEIRVYDKEGNFKLFDHQHLNGDPEKRVHRTSGGIFRDDFNGFYPFLGKLAFNDRKGFFVFDKPGDLVFTEYYGRYTHIGNEDRPVFERTTLPFQGVVTADVFEQDVIAGTHGVLPVNTYNINGDTTNYMYYLLRNGLVKLTSKVDSATAKLFKHHELNIHASASALHIATNMNYDSLKGEFWWRSLSFGEIFKFNVITEEAVEYKPADFPISTYIAQMKTLIEEMVLIPDNNGDFFPVALLSNRGLLLDYPHLFPEGKRLNYLLFLKDGEWDTVKIEIDAPDFWKAAHSSVERIFKWPIGYSKVAITYRNYGVYTGGNIDEITAEDYEFCRSIILYDFETKEFSNFVLPKELVAEGYIPDSHGYFPFMHGAEIQIKEIVNQQGEKCVGILSRVGKLFEYDPAKEVSIEDTESLNFVRLWFRELFPNPATHGTVTANIMCYVSDISTVELGLYDFMGQKVLDLSNSFEYEQATRTISTTFEIPKSLAKGSYFIVVRSGKETRTKGIIVK